MTVEKSDVKVFPQQGALELHSLSALFPSMTDAEYAALKADIEAHGLHQSIVTHEGAILDGGNRYRACMEIGIEPKIEEFAGGDPVAFVLSANLHRRHLSPGQQAAIVASAQDWGRAQTVGGDGSNQHKSKAATLPDSAGPRDTVASRAAQSGASERTQRMADAVAKASPELAKQVAHGEVSLPQAIRQITPAGTEPATPAACDPVLPSPFPVNKQFADPHGDEHANTLAAHTAAKPHDPAPSGKRAATSAAAPDELVTDPYTDIKRLKLQIKMLESDVVQRDKTIQTLNDRLAARDKKIDVLKKNHGAKLEKLSGRIADRDATIERLKSELKTFKTENGEPVRADAGSKPRRARSARDDQGYRSELEGHGQLRLDGFDAEPK
ncbi:Chromosome segregation protein Spo0J, contains ParB-like nuclease domain [Burkholderia sp. D7]|nr:Chromosome segregation protein Spo0J, contains ParB-like nuclease domain [Burkholderia sp. D7]